MTEMFLASEWSTADSGAVAVPRSVHATEAEAVVAVSRFYYGGIVSKVKAFA